MDEQDFLRISDLLAASRRRAGLTLRALAKLAGTSAPTIATYESRKKEPRLSTLGRLIRATGAELHLVVLPADVADPSLTREQRRSLKLHRAIVSNLIADPDATLAIARRNVSRMRDANNDGSAEHWFSAWEHLLDGPLELLISVMVSPSQRASSLRQVTPFAGVLTPQERWDVYRSFRDAEQANAA